MSNAKHENHSIVQKKENRMGSNGRRCGPLLEESSESSSSLEQAIADLRI